MEGESSKMQSESPPQYSQPDGQPQPQYGEPQPGEPQPQYGQPQPQYGQPQPQYGQPPVMMQPVPMWYPPPANQQQQQQQSTVVVNQTSTGPAIKPLRAWSTGVCGCCDNMAICCCVAFCPVCAGCQLATDMGESCCVACCVPGWLNVLRTKLRTQHNIHGSVMDDCCTICWCHQCVLCQMMREVSLTRPEIVVLPSGTNLVRA